MGQKHMRQILINTGNVPKSYLTWFVSCIYIILQVSGEEEHETYSGDARASRWSETEAFYRTGIWSGVKQGPYQPSALGGSTFIRAVPVYDRVTDRPLCTKHKTPNSSHIPGVMIHW